LSGFNFASVLAVMASRQNYLGAGVPRKVADFLGQRTWMACENEQEN